MIGNMLYVTVEGIDGCGKTTLTTRLIDALKEKGFRVDDLVAKNKSTYNARIFMKPYTDEKQKEKWGFGLDFINTRGNR